MEFYDWLKLGQQKGYCTTLVCATHDGIPTTEAEDLSWEEGEDPCAYIVRIPESKAELEAIRKNYPGNYS